MKWTRLTAIPVLLLGLVVSPAALAVGGPVQPVQGNGIGAPDSPYSYAAFGAGRDTVVKRFDGGVVSELRVAGSYGVPAVDYSGTTTGLSADGRTLILADIPRTFPPRATRLLVLDAAPGFALRARLTLRGWSTVDAISPDGRWLYLIQYRSANLGSYAVRAYDLLARRMLPQPVVDPREPDEKMTGVAVTRVMSAGDRWAYTLYFRPSGAPFVHALDTVHHRAVCVDLPSLSNTDIGTWALRLAPGGGALLVHVDGATRARIDTRTFAVTTGAGAAATTPSGIRPTTTERRRSAGTPWLPIALVLVALATLGAVAVGLTRRVRSPGSPAPARPERDEQEHSLSS